MSPRFHKDDIVLYEAGVGQGTHIVARAIIVNFPGTLGARIKILEVIEKGAESQVDPNDDFFSEFKFLSPIPPEVTPAT